jgi:uncharacterized protein with HEPN domain
MPSDDTWLTDMWIYARRARGHADGHSQETFLSNHQTQDAITYAVLVVGKAAAQVSGERRNEIPGLPWREIVGMRNRLVHRYFDVDLDVLWDVVQSDLPEVIETIELYWLDRGIPLPESS